METTRLIEEKKAVQIRTVGHVAVGRTFRRSAIEERQRLEQELDDLRARLKPVRRVEEELVKEIGRIDDILLDAWDKGVRGHGVEVVETPAAQRWSKALVEKVAKTFRHTYDECVEAVGGFGLTRKVTIRKP